MKKKVLGYGYVLRDETLEYALSLYGDRGFIKNLKTLRKLMTSDLEGERVAKKDKPKVFKVVVEIEE